VYSVADVEDAVKKGVLPWTAIQQSLNTPEDPTVTKAIKGMVHILKAGRDAVPQDLPDDVYASAFRTAAIGILVHSVVDTFKNQYGAIMQGTYQGELVEDCDAKSLVARLKKLHFSRIALGLGDLGYEAPGQVEDFPRQPPVRCDRR
jgi:dGTPase